MRFWLDEPDFERHFRLWCVYVSARCINMAILGFMVGTIIGWLLLEVVEPWY